MAIADYFKLTPRGFRRLDAARYVGVSPSKFDELVRDGRMPEPFHIDACRIWDLHDLDSAIDTLKSGEIRNPWDRDKGVAV